MSKDIVVIPFNVPWTWSTDYLNQTAFELAKKGNTVICFLSADTIFFKDFTDYKNIKIFKKYSKNIYLLRPVNYLPFRRFRIVRYINSGINKFILRFISLVFEIKNKYNRKIFWIFDPNLLPVFGVFKNYTLLYDCVDFFAVGSADNIKRTKLNEKNLCKTADLVVANSTVLVKHLSKYRKPVYLVPQGFRSENCDIKKSKFIKLKAARPVIGFVGGINNRLDTSLLLSLIKKNPKWNFVLWGPTQSEIDTGSDRFKEIGTILSFPNVHTGSSTDKEEIPGIISQFDVGIIPYDASQDFNKYCYPMKLFEYFYLGKPVVSTNIIELKRFPKLVAIAKSPSEWETAIKKILSKKWTYENIKEEKRLALGNSWKEKVSAIAALLD